MKLQIMSDTHHEFYSSEPELFMDECQTDADALILAGDVMNLDARGLPWAQKLIDAYSRRYPHVIFVPGNHEFYGTSIEAGLMELRLLAGKAPNGNFHVLEADKQVTIKGQRFLGATMWQPTPPDKEYTQEITDHRAISAFRQEAPRAYRNFKGYLEATLTSTDVVVTHHAPSTVLIAKEFMGSPANRWFITPEVEPLILTRGPKLWVCGHIHTFFDTKLYTTRLIANPRGYPNEGVDFHPKMVVEV